jgi:hypothetical protein
MFNAKLRQIANLLAILALATGCSTMDIEDFVDQGPQLQIEDYFQGNTKAWGLFEDRFGAVRRQFTVDINGTWDGTELVLDEKFIFNDGETDRRVWRIKKKGVNQYVGRADDVVGSAEGKAFGNALHWRYDVNMKIGGRDWRVTFDDWMFLQAGDALINRASVSKWGIEIGSVTLFFIKAGTLGSAGV